MILLSSFHNQPSSPAGPRQASVLGLILALLLMQQATGGAQNFDKEKYFQARLAKSRQAAPRVVGNDFYQIVIEEAFGAGRGLYSVRTGERHPVTNDRTLPNGPKDLLAGASKTLSGTSYTTIHSYNTNTDYVQTDLAKSVPRVATVWLDTLAINDVELDSSIIKIENVEGGCRVTYTLPGLPQPGRSIGDTLQIIQETIAHGQVFDDAWVEITTIVENTGTQPVDLGIRYLWDLNIAGDDGPVLSQRGGGPFGPNETVISPADYAFYLAEANDSIRVSPPAYNVFGSALTPGSLRRSELQPSLMQQVFWPRAFFTAFDYVLTDTLRVVGGQDDALSRLTGGDNAVFYYWGESRANALRLRAGESLTVTQALFAGAPNGVVDWVPPMCDLMSINPGPPKSIEVAVHDEASGLAAIRVLEAHNAIVDIPDFDFGTNEHVHVTGTAVDPAQPFSFTIVARDLSGNQAVCDPILFAWHAALPNNEYHFAPTFADRYFYLRNEGVERITVELNGARFVLSTSESFGGHTFKMPLHGEMAIDLSRHLREDQNKMTLTFAGPPGSRTDILLADMNPKGQVDLVLDLSSVPKQFTLAQNLPNPFRGRTVIRFELPPSEQSAQLVDLRIYNTLGQVVRQLLHRVLNTNAHVAEWDGLDDYGRAAAPGVYFYRLTAGNLQLTKKMALVR